MIDVVTLVGTSLPRSVQRWFPDVMWRVPVRDRVAFLTFDDGPNPGLTERFVSILERYDAGATFFVLGARARQHPELVRLLVDAGHTVGNHTFSHPDGWRADADEMIRELERTTDLLEDLTNGPIRWMRPPYGRFTRRMRDWCLLRRQVMTMWDVGTGDFLPRVSGDHVLRHVSAYVRPGSVVVLHDNPCCADTTPDALERLLERLVDEGWRFAPLDQAATTGR